MKTMSKQKDELCDSVSRKTGECRQQQLSGWPSTSKQGARSKTAQRPKQPTHVGFDDDLGADL